MPVREHVPLYFANMVLIMVYPFVYCYRTELSAHGHRMAMH